MYIPGGTNIEADDAILRTKRNGVSRTYYVNNIGLIPDMSEEITAEEMQMKQRVPFADKVLPSAREKRGS